MGLVYLDNKILKEEEARISIDEGFLYGYGLFETMRSYEGKIFLLDSHIQRLVSSCSLIGLKPPDKLFLIKKTKQILKQTNTLNAYIRINLWKSKEDTKFCIILREFKPHPEKIYEKGFKCIISKFRQNEYSILSKVKSLNYLNNKLALKEAEEKKADEAIILNTKENLCEGSRTNLFLIKDSKIFTPSLDCGCLEGITRNMVIDIAKKEGLEVYETKLFTKDFFSSQEAFLTNSLLEIIPITFLDGKPINQGKPGEITKFLLNKYRELVWDDKQN